MILTTRIRKLVLLLILLAAHAPAWSQSERINLPGNRLSLFDIITNIERQSKYLFAYDPAAVDTKTWVTIDYRNTTVGNVIGRVNDQTGYNLSIRNRYILINTAPQLLPKTLAPAEVITAPISADSPEQLQDSTLADNRFIGENLPGPLVDPATTSTPFIVTPISYSSYKPVDLYRPISRKLPIVNIKINLLYGAAAQAPNLAAEVGLGLQHSFELSGSYNPWKRKASSRDNDKLLHWTIRPEYRYWFNERFNGHYIGGHAFYNRFNISGHKIPTLFKKEYRYDGYAIGAGFTYGYSLPIAKRWNLDFTIGIGGAYLDYDRYDCKLCSKDKEPKTDFYFGPTRAAASIVFIIK